MEADPASHPRLVSYRVVITPAGAGVRVQRGHQLRPAGEHPPLVDVAGVPRINRSRGGKAYCGEQAPQSLDSGG
jgi:hypothetical protein